MKIQKRIKEKAEKHSINELLGFFFSARKNKNKINTLQTWIDAIFAKEKLDNVESWNEKTTWWVAKIKNGQWITNSFGKKLFFKLG